MVLFSKRMTSLLNYIDLIRNFKGLPSTIILQKRYSRTILQNQLEYHHSEKNNVVIIHHGMIFLNIWYVSYPTCFQLCEILLCK